MLKKRVKISRHITTGPQPGEPEIEELAKAGFRKIINLSAKGEIDQILSPEDEEEKVREAGMEYVHLPVSLNNIKADYVDAFCQEIAGSEKPVYVHCRIGQRSVPLCLIYHALRRKLSADALFQKATTLGIELHAPIMRDVVSAALRRREQQTA